MLSSFLSSVSKVAASRHVHLALPFRFLSFSLLSARTPPPLVRSRPLLPSSQPSIPIPLLWASGNRCLSHNARVDGQRIDALVISVYAHEP